MLAGTVHSVQLNLGPYTYFPKSNFNIILVTSLSWSPKRPLLFRYYDWIFECVFYLSGACHLTPVSIPHHSVTITTYECMMSINYGVARNVIVFCLLAPYFLLGTLFSNTLSNFIPSNWGTRIKFTNIKSTRWNFLFYMVPLHFKLVIEHSKLKLYMVYIFKPNKLTSA
jgi:hypothetical protein